MLKPLHGITVIDLSRALAGPYCTALMADMGARVIKVESINGGDTARQWPPFQDGHSLYFDSVNRNKSSVCLDFYSAEGREILSTLISGADVLVENFKRGTLEAMGFPPERLHELNPGLVVGSVTGYGTTGPLKDDAGLDQVIQGMSGLMSVTGPGSAPGSGSRSGAGYRVGVPIVDITSGIVCAFGIVSTLLGNAVSGNRAGGSSGAGSVSTSLLETALNLSVFQGQKALSLGEAPAPQGNNHPVLAPYGMFATATESINIAVGSQKQWNAFCELLGVVPAADDPRFRTGALRSEHRDELTELIEHALATKPAAEWVPLISRAGIPCGPIYNYAQAFASDQVAALGLVQQGRRRDGSPLPLLRGPVSVDGEPSEILSPPPLLGEHTAEVLIGLGMTYDEVSRLEGEGRILCATATMGARS